MLFEQEMYGEDELVFGDGRCVPVPVILLIYDVSIIKINCLNSAVFYVLYTTKVTKFSKGVRGSVCYVTREGQFEAKDGAKVANPL
jgi:hypothetical protein